MPTTSPHPPPVARIDGPRVTLAAVTGDHVEALQRIVRTPEVHAWWSTPEPDFPFDTDDETVPYTVLLGDRVIGYVQFYEENDPMYHHGGIDLFLDPAVHGQGYGREVVATVAAHLFDVRGHHRVVIDPCAENAAAIATYTAVGFQPCGVMRQYERSPEGVWRDGLLMDVLAGELVRP
ncbi:GNAT family N-acetyltransferase [Spongisporangium articulatum]|uniref:GNAT family N-acetyltransferase n=1 Tax=Spongisporangium articulatum TaxID=3362603 RepID=A0ABW8ARA2_9ACTN